jgi:FkbM family methyltransferase
MITDYELWLASAVPEKGEVAIDVGANRGVWTRELARRFIRVHAIEPNPEVLPLLKADLPVNVIVHEIAAWNVEGLLHFKRYASPDHLSAYNEGALLGQIGMVGPVLGEIELTAIPLDVLPIQGKVDFIKIDTEGAEVQIITGAAQLIRKNRPKLLVEIHAAENFKRLSVLLSDWHYIYRVIEHPLLAPDSPYRTELFWVHATPSLGSG